MDDNQVHHITAGTAGLAFGEDVRSMLSVSAILDELRIHRPSGRDSSKAKHKYRKKYQNGLKK
ncbi:MAG: hypothetical protein R6U96_14885 [Promethearchaeia archaeon]